MLTYIAGRLAQALLVLLAAYTGSFLLLQALPGDAFMIKFTGPELGLSVEQLEALRIAYGVDQPVWLQYVQSVGRVLTGDFGTSIQYGVPVTELMGSKLPTTIRLAVLSLLVAVALAFIIAMVASMAPRGWMRAIARSLPAVFVSIPVFGLGIMLIQIFSFRFRLIPVINPGEWQGLILPVLTLGTLLSAPLAQVLIRNLNAISTQPFVAVARAKGASHRRVLWTHVLGNAVLPTITITGLILAELLGGAVITETVFGLSGIGSMTVAAVNYQDLPVLQVMVLFAAGVFVAINLLVDLLYLVLDPRLRDGVKT